MRESCSNWHWSFTHSYSCLWKQWFHNSPVLNCFVNTINGIAIRTVTSTSWWYTYQWDLFHVCANLYKLFTFQISYSWSFCVIYSDLELVFPWNYDICKVCCQHLSISTVSYLFLLSLQNTDPPLNTASWLFRVPIKVTPSSTSNQASQWLWSLCFMNPSLPATSKSFKTFFNVLLCDRPAKLTNRKQMLLIYMHFTMDFLSISTKGF